MGAGTLLLGRSSRGDRPTGRSIINRKILTNCAKKIRRCLADPRIFTWRRFSRCAFRVTIRSNGSWSTRIAAARSTRTRHYSVGQKRAVLLSSHDSISKGFFRTPVHQAPRPNRGGRRSRPRSRSTDSPARIVEHEENNSSGPVTFPLWLTAPAAAGSPLPRLRGPYHPPLWSSRLVPRGGRRAFFRNFEEVLIVSPRHHRIGKYVCPR
jgi:hypothetical protein